MSIVVCKLPRAGLGNQLFPLLNAAIFSQLNNIPLIVTGYHYFKIGPYLRKEKSKRKYNDYFTFQKSVATEALDLLKIYLLKKKLKAVYESPVAQLDKNELHGKIFFFEKLPRYHDYFIHLKDHRKEVKKILQSLLKPWIFEKVEKAEKPVIGVHIRMGDFRKLKQGEDFSKVGHVRTPEKYFIDVIKCIRITNGKELPVMVFTDGYRNEFEKLFDLNNIKIVEGNADVVDLLLLSKSKIIVTANGSTFSYWAAFLSDAPVIKHPDHLYAPFRPDKINAKYYEGPLMAGNVLALLEKNIKDIT